MSCKKANESNKSANLSKNTTNDDSNSDDEDSNQDNLSCIEEEEESESEPEIECELWDRDCRVINRKTNSQITGYHLMSTCSQLNSNETNQNKKLKLSAEIHPDLLTQQFSTEFKTNWNLNQGFNTNKLELITKPFKVCVVNDFIENTMLLENVRQELFNEIDWNNRRLDLYEFFQSKDLKYLNQLPVISTIHEFLENDVMKWVSDLTGFKLTHLSSTCSFYSNTDYLLVHDDQRSDRMVAFILYLTGTEGWRESKGGALQLLTKDSDTGQPTKAIRDVFPANNQFVFFPVTSDSYHQVAEVTSLEDCRLSINGWFHTDIAPIFNTPIFHKPTEGLFSFEQIRPETLDIDLSLWLSSDYLNKENIDEIQDYFEEHSEICLKYFFKSNCFNEILLSLENNSELIWKRIGPLNRYCYDVIDNQSLTDFLKRFLNIFKSREMFDLLKKYACLDLKSMKCELQRWTPGSYSLLTDYDWQKQKELDLIITFGCNDNSDVIGARTQYVTMDEEIQSALITIEPEQNNLNIIYRDTARFTSYFSKQSRCQCFYMLICSYVE